MAKQKPEADDGQLMSYRAIAEALSEEGDLVSESTVRRTALRALEKCRQRAAELGLTLEDLGLVDEPETYHGEESFPACIRGPAFNDSRELELELQGTKEGTDYDARNLRQRRRQRA